MSATSHRTRREVVPASELRPDDVIAPAGNGPNSDRRATVTSCRPHSRGATALSDFLTVRFTWDDGKEGVRDLRRTHRVTRFTPR